MTCKAAAVISKDLFVVSLDDNSKSLSLFFFTLIIYLFSKKVYLPLYT